MGKARIAARIVIAIAIAGVVIWRLPINGWGSLLWVATAVAMVAIRQPYEAIISENEIAESRRTTLEIVLLAAMGLGTMALPLVHLMFGLLSFATYNLPVWAPLVGAVVLAWGLYLFRMTHSDLGRNWSVMLELREGHDLTTTGIYSRIRHPMYSAIFLICASQPFFVQNWIAGPAGLIAFTLNVRPASQPGGSHDARSVRRRLRSLLCSNRPAVAANRWSGRPTGKRRIPEALSSRRDSHDSDGRRRTRPAFGCACDVRCHRG